MHRNAWSYNSVGIALTSYDGFLMVYGFINLDYSNRSTLIGKAVVFNSRTTKWGSAIVYFDFVLREWGTYLKRKGFGPRRSR